MPADEHHGSCLCRAVTFTITCRMPPGIACHCSMCRKQTGLFFTSSEIAADALAISGEENVAWYDSSRSARRGFCSRCGSVLFWEEKGTPVISVALGSLDAPTGMRVERHIFTDDKGDFYDVRDHHAIV